MQQFLINALLFDDHIIKRRYCSVYALFQFNSFKKKGFMYMCINLYGQKLPFGEKFEKPA